MEKIIKRLVFLFLVITIIYGLGQLEFQSTILAESMYPCCNNGYCNNSDCDDIVTVKIYSDNCAQDYVVNCRQCIQYIYNGQACGVRPGQCCDDGTPEGFCGDPAK